MDNFEEALDRLISEWLEMGETAEGIISGLELKLMALKEQFAAAEDE